MEREPEAEWQFRSADANIFGEFLLHPRDFSRLYKFQAKHL